MTSGDKESSKPLKDLQRVSDFIPEGSSEPEYANIKSLANIDLKIVSIVVKYGRDGNVSYLIVTVETKTKEIVVKITQRKVVKKLSQVLENLPLQAKFVKGKRVWDVI